MVGEIGAALHVVDAGAESAVALDPKRQTFDKPQGMHGVEMAQHQDSGLLLAPRRTRHEMIAAAGVPCDALDGGGANAECAFVPSSQACIPTGRFRAGLCFEPSAYRPLGCV